jgi:hypothetical protein
LLRGWEKKRKASVAKVSAVFFSEKASQLNEKLEKSRV